MTKSMKVLAATGLAAAMIAAITPDASAQGQPKAKQDDVIRMPTPRKSDPDPPVLWSYFAVLVILGTVFVANMIPSKRGHQD